MPLSSVRKVPRASVFPRLTVAAPVTGTAAGGCVAAAAVGGGGAAVGVACGPQAVASRTKTASALKTRYVLFIFSPLEMNRLSRRSTLGSRVSDCTKLSQGLKKCEDHPKRFGLEIHFEDARAGRLGTASRRFDGYPQANEGRNT